MTPDDIKTMVVNAIIDESMGSARTAQAEDYRLGASDLGQCRSFLWRFIRQDQRHEREDIPWPAFIGTALGDRLESALGEVSENIEAQRAVLTTFPSGITVPGHVDLFGLAYDDEPGWVLDFKAKDGTRMWVNGELDRSNVYQIATYHRALVQEGLISPEAPAYLVFLDRSGKNPEPVVRQVDVTDDLIAEIDQWVADAIEGVLSHEEPPRDRPYTWCEVACPFFLDCRGSDETLADGRLIEAPEHLTALEQYVKGKALEKQGREMAEEAKDALVGVSGTGNGVVLSWTHVGGSEFMTRRQPYDRMNVRKLKR